jgi:hypothetical protein
MPGRRDLRSGSARLGGTGSAQGDPGPVCVIRRGAPSVVAPRRQGRRGSAIDVGEPEEASDAVHHRVDRGVHQPARSQMADEQFDMCALYPNEWVERVRLAPLEPAAKLVGVSLWVSPEYRPDTKQPQVAPHSLSQAGTEAHWCWTWQSPAAIYDEAPATHRRQHGEAAWSTLVPPRRTSESWIQGPHVGGAVKAAL